MLFDFSGNFIVQLISWKRMDISAVFRIEWFKDQRNRARMTWTNLCRELLITNGKLISAQTVNKNVLYSLRMASRIIRKKANLRELLEIALFFWLVRKRWIKMYFIHFKMASRIIRKGENSRELLEIALFLLFELKYYCL